MTRSVVLLRGVNVGGHNRIAMEMAEQLIGVTMQEQGVSRVVTVDMPGAVRLAEAA